jgi:hypothetical protein
MTDTHELLRDGDDLHARMERAVTGLQPPTDRLEAQAVTGGRRLRRRRRLGAAALATAAAVAAAAMVIPQLGGDPTSARDRTLSPADRTTAETVPEDSPEPTDGPDADPFPDVVPAGWWDAPVGRLHTELEARLPEGVTIAALDRHTRETDVGSIAGTLDAPTGPGGFEILLYPPDLEEVPDPVTTTDAAGNEVTSVWATGPSNLSRVTCGRQARHTDTCEEILGADGEPIGRLTTALQDETITFYEATLLGPDEGLVYLSVWNATDEKPGPDTPTSAPVPPLTLEQLRELVEDPVWTSYQP